MFLIKTGVRNFGHKRNGAYAKENIKQGQCIWSFDKKYDKVFTFRAFQKSNELVKQYLFNYGYLCEINKKFVVVMCFDHAKYMNHDLNPNTIADPQDEFKCIASRDIQEDEELTCNYYHFDLWTPEIRGF
jgi:uncharacterized protein